MSKFILNLLFFTTAFINSYTQDSSFIQLSKLQFNKSDTLRFDCNLTSYKTQNIHYATLHVWVESLETHKFWKFRYPIINGETKGNLIIDASLPDGKYAFNFLVQRNFFQLEGQITNYQITQKDINYIIITKDGNSYLNTFAPNTDGSFKLKGHLFEDTVSFVFTPSARDEENTLMVNIKSSLDSFFTADTNFTQIIQIGTPKNIVQNKITPAANYHFNYAAFYKQTTLPNVFVEGKIKKKIEKFDEKYSTGLFKGSSRSVRVFDGIESDHIQQYKSFIEFLKTQVPGLHIDDLSGGNGGLYNNKYLLIWDGTSDFHLINKKPKPEDSNVEIFVDEIRQDLTFFDWYSINTHDIAMIKTYPPPSGLGTGGGKGAIAIYTRRNDFEIETKGNYKFTVFGYSKPELVWKK